MSGGEWWETYKYSVCIGGSLLLVFLLLALASWTTGGPMALGTFLAQSAEAFLASVLVSLLLSRRR